MRTLVLSITLAALCGGCTVVNTAQIPSDRSGRELFLTSGDIPEPYDSLGVIQATRSGVRLFGFFDPVGTDLDTGLRKVLLPEIQRLGGDGAINVRYHMTQYTPVTMGIAAVLFVIPLPSQVTVSGEVVKLRARR